ncbi:MAG: hypothetical protein NTW26_04030 [bacterium]|nr:hypothetical protein [bacterium]
MRAFVLVLTLACAAAALGGVSATPAPPPPDLDVLWENPYDYELLVYGLLSNGSDHTQDDFTLEESGVVKGFECWFCYDGNHPQPFTATMFYDYDGKPSGRKWIADISDVTDTDTGDDFGDLDVYHTKLLLDEGDYVFIEAGATFWLELYWTGFYYGVWLCESGGNAHFNGDEYNLSTFFTILGVRSGEYVEAVSWGEIKATF